MKRTGELLKNAREEKNLSLHEIGISLKINNKVLKAIEEGDAANLPAKTFLRGFVKSYATYLKMNVDEVMQVFQEEQGSTKHQPMLNASAESAATDKAAAAALDGNAFVEGSNSTDKKSEAKTEEERPRLTPIEPERSKGTWAFVGLIFLLLVAIFITKKVIDRYSKEATVESAQIDSDTSKPLNNVVDASTGSTGAIAADIKETVAGITGNTGLTAAPVATITPSADEKSKVEIKSEVVPVKVEPKVEVAKVEKKPEEVKVEAPKVEIPKVEVPKAEVKNEAKTEKKEEAVKPEGKPVELIVEALDAIDVEYSAGGGKTQVIHLSAQQVHTFKSKSGLKLNLSNGGAANLTLNGKDLGVPGEMGKPKKMSF